MCGVWAHMVCIDVLGVCVGGSVSVHMVYVGACGMCRCTWCGRTWCVLVYLVCVLVGGCLCTWCVWVPVLCVLVYLVWAHMVCIGVLGVCMGLDEGACGLYVYSACMCKWRVCVSGHPLNTTH